MNDVDARALAPFPPLPSATAFRSALREAAAARADEPQPDFHESGMTPADEAALPPLDDYADFSALPF